MKGGKFDTFEERSIAFGRYIVENNATVRQTAKEFGIGKTAIHNEIYGRLKDANPLLYEQTKVVLERNKSERHLRGGMATKWVFC